MNITPYSISKRVKKPPQSVYRRIESILNNPPIDNIKEHIRKENDKWIITEIGENIIVSSFSVEQNGINIEQQIEHDIEQCCSNCSRLKDEIIELKVRLQAANEELNKEREFSRSQIISLTEKVLAQNEKLIKLNENQQILLAQSQQKIPMLTAETETKEKQNVFARIFRRNKKETDR